MSPRFLSLLAAPLLLAAPVAAQPGARPASADRPNIVFILADDLGWADTTPYGSTYFKTPNIARLASRGMLYTNAYAANPLCSPTRASILTGQYPARIGITAPVGHLPEVKLTADLQPAPAPTQKAQQVRSATRLKTDYITLAEVLKESGYATGHFGKWHLGQEPYSPLEHGFSVDVPHYHGPGPAGSYVAPWKFPPALNFSPRTPSEHIEDRMADEAAAFIRAHKTGKPFFLNYWAFSVHAPYDAKDTLVETYRKTVDTKNPQQNPVYAAMVHSLDDAVGKLLDTLDAEGLSDKTMVVFFSDNGGVNWVGHGANRFREMADTAPTSNAPLRGGKASVYEGGTREPCIVSWPGKVKPGSRSSAFLSSVDWFPTLLEIAGATPPASQKLDGVSQMPSLRGQGTPRSDIFGYFPHYTPATRAVPTSWVRRGDWKLLRFHADGENGADRFELYNLKDDVGETTNLAARHPDRVRDLDARITGFLSETGAVVPIPNPRYDKNARSGPVGRNPARVAGWSADNACVLAVKSGTLVITATGSDPHLSTPLPSLSAGEYVLTLRLKSSASGNGQVFWEEQGAVPRFAAARRVEFPLTHDGQWKEYSVRFRAARPIKGLRLDPAQGKGEITLSSLSLKDSAGKVVREWPFIGTANSRKS